MTLQRTLRRSISCTGIGLHSGKKVSLSLKPAPAGFGIRFQRSDLGGGEVAANVRHVATLNYATGLAHEAASVDTVEHLLAALSSQGIDHVLVELNHPEVPIMDGSAAPIGGFVSRGYYPPVALLAKSASIHGKPAADVLWYWYTKFLGR